VFWFVASTKKNTNAEDRDVCVLDLWHSVLEAHARFVSSILEGGFTLNLA
jgi:hypothetical protein